VRVEPYPQLPLGVEVRPLLLHGDERGSFVEIFRDEWGCSVEPVQWNAVRSVPGTLRGVHVHAVHDDYLVVVNGHAAVGLHDLRPGSPTDGLAALVELPAKEPAALLIPAGVAHGFYFREHSLHIYGVTHYWSHADELSCRWDDPELAIPWPEPPTLLSERDRTAPTFAVMRTAFVSALDAARA
jgi:dTDP-4-dehydrorhamnose 3,5-epimerase